MTTPLLSTPLLLDGATGTELARRGVDVSLPLWSARAIVDAPDVLEAVHGDYLRAGAGAVTTATFRTHRRSLARAGRGDEARALTKRAVAIARRACDEVRPDALVLGSVAPLEECYRPELAPDEATCRREHALLIGDLVDAGVDLVLVETMNCAREARGAAQAARELAPGRWMLSVIAAEDEPGRFPDGGAISDVFDEMDDAVAIGVNCVSAPATAAHVSWLVAHRPDHLRVAAYANVGCAAPDGSWISTDAVAPERYADHAMAWLDAGATIVGGCCGTRPATLTAISGRLLAERA